MGRGLKLLPYTKNHAVTTKTPLIGSLGEFFGSYGQRGMRDHAPHDKPTKYGERMKSQSQHGQRSCQRTRGKGGYLHKNGGYVPMFILPQVGKTQVHHYQPWCHTMCRIRVRFGKLKTCEHKSPLEDPTGAQNSPPRDTLDKKINL